MINESMELANKIAVAATNYYLGTPIMSDEEFDRLVEKLEVIDNNHKVLNSVGWGLDLDASPLEKVAHPYCKLLGLPKSKISETDFLVTEGYDKVHTPKLDGLSVEVLYKNGLLDKAITRGNGEVGLDITSKIRHLVPLVLPEEVDLSVRGEFVLSFDNYYKYYSDSPSPRNIASGVLNRKEVDIEEIRRFNLVTYKIIASSSDNLEMLTNRRYMLNLLDIYGFEVVPHITTNKDLSYAKVYNSLTDRLKRNYPLDGVVTSSTIERLSKVGNVHVVDYEGEIAYKTITETATSKVTEISWNLTRTGKLIPTVIYEPVELSGATLTRALGHNAKYISDNLIDAGAVIEVVRSGEVIPYILGVEEPSNEVNIPKVCPSCGGSTKWKGVDIVCTNPNCSSKEDANIRHWIYNTSPVHGVGGSLITSIIDALNITCVEDLYKVTDSDITKLYSTNGIGHNKIELVRSLFFELNKHKDLATFLVGLNLDGLGWSSANKLVSNELYDLIRKKQRKIGRAHV